MTGDKRISLSAGSKSTIDGDEFRPYLDAVRTAAERTRFSLYLIMLAVVCTVTVCRDITPIGGWTSGRAKVLRAATTSYDRMALKDPSFRDTDFDRKSRAALDLTDDSSRKRLDPYLDELAKESVALTRVQLPLLGVSIDANDFGVVAALTFLVLLLVFRANQEGVTHFCGSKEVV